MRGGGGECGGGVDGRFAGGEGLPESGGPEKTATDGGGVAEVVPLSSVDTGAPTLASGGGARAGTEGGDGGGMAAVEGAGAGAFTTMGGEGEGITPRPVSACSCANAASWRAKVFASKSAARVPAASAAAVRSCACAFKSAAWLLSKRESNADASAVMRDKAAEAARTTPARGAGLGDGGGGGGCGGGGCLAAPAGRSSAEISSRRMMVARRCNKTANRDEAHSGRDEAPSRPAIGEGCKSSALTNA